MRGDEERQARLWLALYRDLGVEEVRVRQRRSTKGRAAAETLPLLGSAAEDAAAIARAVEMDDPRAALETLAREVLGDCRRCRLAGGRTNVVFGVGDPEARLMFVGEGPGADEDRKGEPFVGRAGQLLDRIIAAMGLSRAQVYIANVVKCRPPENRAPTPDEAAACLPFLRAQIAIVRPEVIVALGRTALEGLLGERIPSMSRARRRWYDCGGVAVKPTFHPAYLLRNPAAKRDVWEDMQEVMQRLGLPRP
ncbi:MAG: uracil-DNA glycosylase [Acidobacteria bacterium]|nr:MAG: uracil-DNA glycosylase [Acidobacteriota bacterium]